MFRAVAQFAKAFTLSEHAETQVDDLCSRVIQVALPSEDLATELMFELGVAMRSHVLKSLHSQCFAAAGSGVAGVRDKALKRALVRCCVVCVTWVHSSAFFCR